MNTVFVVFIRDSDFILSVSDIHIQPKIATNSILQQNARNENKILQQHEHETTYMI
jgi:hypothetical protein